MTVEELIAELQQFPPDTIVLTSGYEGGLTPAGIGEARVQLLDRHGQMDWLGDWERAEEAEEQAAQPDGPSPLVPMEGFLAPTLVGDAVVAAVIYRSGR